MKKGLIKCMLIILFLGSCGLIGQIRNNENFFSNEEELDEVIQDSLLMEMPTVIDDMEFEGVMVANDNSWNITAGYIDEGEEKNIF